MRKYVVPLMVLASGLLFQCSDKGTNPPKPDPGPNPVELTIAEKATLQASNTFGLKLFKEIVGDEPDTSNVFISPLSVSMALGMVLNGAEGETKLAMQRTLELSGLSDQQINESYHNVMALLSDLDPSVKFQVGNAIFYRQGAPVADSFVDVNQTYFEAAVRALDFSLLQSADTINDWVYEHTNGKIKDIVEKPLDSSLVMFLLNAIYFKGDWTRSFDEQYTHDWTFQAPEQQNFICKMMHTEMPAKYYESGTFEVLDLPYGEGNYSMTIFLPTPSVGVDSLLNLLTPEAYHTALNQLETDSVNILLPKFKMEYYVGLKKVLKAMGMSVAFDPDAADFSRMVREGNCFISDARHKTFVDVNERGTEAAAVTIIEVGETSAGPIPSFIADRPFIFMIRENVSQTILFMGKIARPEYQ
jgi:serine protease inhibitor